MNRLHTMRWLVDHTGRLLTPLVLSALARIGSQLLGVALLVVAAAAVSGAASGDGVPVLRLAGILIALALLKAGLRYAEHFAGHWVAFTALQRLRELFFARLIPQAPAATKGRAGAALTETATRDIDRVEVFFAHTFPPAVSAVVVPVLTLAWLGAVTEAALAWTLAPFALAVLLLPLVSAGTVWRASRRVVAGRGDVAAQMGDDIAGVREVLMLGAQQVRLRSLAHAGHELTRARSRAGVVEGVRTALLSLVQAGALIAVLAVGVHWGAAAEAVLLSLAVAVGLRGPLSGIDGFATGLDSALASAERLRAVVDAPPAVSDGAIQQPAGAESTDADGARAELLPVQRGAAEQRAALGPTVEFEGVTHSVGDREILTDVSAVLPGARWSYLAGVSGSGKSSLASLLLRDWDPASGHVLVGGTDVTRRPLAVLRKEVAMVDQRPTLLAESLGENLRLAAPEASDAAVISMLEALGLGPWFRGLPEGLETPIASGRNQVSGGQLQRLALVRTLLGEPRVLILDEALSQLDAGTAAQVRQLLEELRPYGTTVEITHRVDLVPEDAWVAVLDGGRLAESGTAGALRAGGGAFVRLAARAG